MHHSPSTLLHWVGGKHDIAGVVTKPFPPQMNVFHDVFLGGGSVLLHVLTNHQVSRAYAYDTNRDLIRFFVILQSTPEKLAIAANKLQTRFNRMRTEDARRNMYNRIRDQFNRSTNDPIHRAAEFLFLNRTAYGGLFRTNARGEFNASYGSPRTPLSLGDKNHMCEIATIVRNVRFIHSDFRDALRTVKNDEFVYCDPPYIPFDKKMPTFYGRYSSKRFSVEDREALFATLLTAPYFFVLSNVGDKEAIETTFPSERFVAVVVPTRRRISRNARACETLIYKKI